MKPDGRILVVGAGVNGSVYAAALHRAGYDVTVLARGKRLEELQEGGIEIEDPLKGTRTVTQVPVVDRLASEDIYEYILVVVRKNQVRDLLPVLAQNQSQSVVFMVNTALGPEEWIAALGAKRVMLGFVFAGGRREGSLIRAMRAKGHAHPIWRSKWCDHRKADQACSASSTAPASRPRRLRTCPTGLSHTLPWSPLWRCWFSSTAAILTPWLVPGRIWECSRMRCARRSPCFAQTAAASFPTVQFSSMYFHDSS